MDMYEKINKNSGAVCRPESSKKRDYRPGH